MPNERLRARMAARGMTAQALATAIGVDAKTVERWVNSERVPYVRTAVSAAAALEEDPVFLWPTLHRGRAARALPSEVVAVYEQRSQMSPAIWQAFFEQATHSIDILVYAALHLHESLVGFNQLLIGKAKAGCTIRVALGAPGSPNVAARGLEEKYGHGIETRCELALMHYRPLAVVNNIEIRTHGTTLYNSIYRADDEMLVNTHVWGVNAFSAPTWHLRQNTSEAMVATYRESFGAVWDQAAPVA